MSSTDSWEACMAQRARERRVAGKAEQILRDEAAEEHRLREYIEQGGTIDRWEGVCNSCGQQIGILWPSNQYLNDIYFDEINGEHWASTFIRHTHGPEPGCSPYFSQIYQVKIR